MLASLLPSTAQNWYSVKHFDKKKELRGNSHDETFGAAFEHERETFDDTCRNPTLVN